MGGVDLLDSFLGKYKIKIRTRKWYLRLFYHLLDVIVINSWLLYRRVGDQQQTPTPMTLKDFKFVIGISFTFTFIHLNILVAKEKDSYSVKNVELNYVSIKIIIVLKASTNKCLY